MDSQVEIENVGATMNVDWNASNWVERLLLTSDGTLTDMLETLCCETLVIRKLRQQGFQTTEPIDALNVAAGDWLVERVVLLQGAQTGRNYVYARSIIALHRLESPLRHQLLTSDTPIGRLWKENRIEIFKEVTEYGRAPAGELGRFFHIDAAEVAWFRTSRVQARGLAVMLITEHFSPDLGRMLDCR